VRSVAEKKEVKGAGHFTDANEKLRRPTMVWRSELDSDGASARMGGGTCVSGVESERVVHELSCYRGREGEGATTGQRAMAIDGHAASGFDGN
jgi:hypothetical protein